MGKLVGPRSGQMVHKIQDSQISSRNRVYYQKNGREGLNPVSKMALTKWDAKFRLEYSVRKNRTTFSDVPLLPEIFSGTTQKVVCQLLSKRIFWKILVNGKQPVISITIT